MASPAGTRSDARLAGDQVTTLAGGQMGVGQLPGERRRALKTGAPMFTMTDALRIAATYVRELEAECGVPLVLLTDATREMDFGWVCFYSADPQRTTELIAGNGPLIIDRGTGALHPCGSALPVEAAIAEYRSTRNGR